MTKTLVSPTTDRTMFLKTFAHVFRNGNWIAEQAWDSGKIEDSPMGIFLALREQFRKATDEQRLHVVKGSTALDIRVNAARIVADEKDSESLDVLTQRQKTKLLELFETYRRKFGFDVIFHVRNYTTASLTQSLEERLKKDRPSEMAITYSEVEGIALMYIEAAYKQALN